MTLASLHLPSDNVHAVFALPSLIPQKHFPGRGGRRRRRRKHPGEKKEKKRKDTHRTRRLITVPSAPGLGFRPFYGVALIVCVAKRHSPVTVFTLSVFCFATSARGRAEEFSAPCERPSTEQLLLRGTIVNMTCGIHENLYI